MPVMDKLAAYWVAHWEGVFPDLTAAVIGWGEPFCFRCGWLAPVPGNGRAGAWRHANGWLERAHLQDHMTGGGNEFDNIVPLCAICHRAMPDFAHSRDDAIAWVKAQQHNSCLDWWQSRTDALWNGENYIPFPGRMTFINAYTQSGQRRARAEQAAQCALAGDYGQARSLMRLAEFSDKAITRVLSAYVNDLARERVAR